MPVWMYPDSWARRCSRSASQAGHESVLRKADRRMELLDMSNVINTCGIKIF